METLVFYSLTAIGHIIPLVELGKLLLTQNPSLSITILLPTLPFKDDSLHHYISSVSSVLPSFTFHFLPSIPLLLNDPSQYPDVEQILFEIIHNTNPHVQKFLEELSSSTPKISAIILDLFCYPALEIGQSLNIPTYFFFTNNAANLALFLNFPAFDKIATGSFRSLGSKQFQIPGLFGVPASEMPEPMMDGGVTYHEIVNVGAHLPKSNGIIVNTFESLEPRAVKALKEETCLPPIFYIGPLMGKPNKDGGGRNEYCLSWLDLQPRGSVVYLGFGSRGTFNVKQIREIAIGLERSGMRFLWVVKAPPNEDKAKRYTIPSDPDLDTLLPEGFVDRTKDRGLVVKSWVPQVAVLEHESLGGFVTHCGWNSILEAVSAGVPMVAWPLYAEQRFNKIVLVEEIKIALPMNEVDNEFVSSEEIERRVKQIINSEEGGAIRERVKNFSKEAKAAIHEGGASKLALARLVKSWEN